MVSNALKELISSTSELAALPTTTVRLLELLDDAAVDAERVLTIIGKDPSLTANLLKLCNSAYYGKSVQPRDIVIDQAVSSDGAKGLVAAVSGK